MVSNHPICAEAVNSRQDTEIQRRNSAIALPRPFGQDKALRTFATNDRSKPHEHEQRQRARQRIDDQALDTGDDRDLRVCEENARAKSCTANIDLCQQRPF